MKFKVRQNELETALKVIKNSKAYLKSGDENTTSLLIKADKDKNELEFIASNLEIWAGAVINADTEPFKDIPDKSSVFEVIEGGKIFVTIYEFIDVMLTYPAGNIIDFETIEKTSGKDKKSTGIYLEGSCVKSGKKKIKKTGFLTREPRIFEEFPPMEENCKEVTISTEKLVKAVDAVEFASGSDEREKYLWGVQIEVIDDGQKKEIDAVATDRNRVCYYQEEGRLKTNVENATIFCPIKTGFYSAIKNLDPIKDVTVKIGERRTIFEQKGCQWHGVPNVVFSTERMPDWRGIVKKFSEQERVSVKVPKKIILQCLNTAESASGGKFGIKMAFNSVEEEVKFSIEKIEMGGIVKSQYEETEELLKVNFKGRELIDSVILPIENLRDIVKRSIGEVIEFRILDSKSSLEIFNDVNTTTIGYICGVVTE